MRRLSPKPEERKAAGYARRRPGPKRPGYLWLKSRETISELTLRFRVAWARGNPLAPPWGDDAAAFARRAVNGYRGLRNNRRVSASTLANYLMGGLGEEDGALHRAHVLELAEIVVETIRDLQSRGPGTAKRRAPVNPR